MKVDLKASEVQSKGMVEVDAIRRCPRFAGISEPCALWIAERMYRRRYSKKERLFMEGDDSDRLIVIERGSVKVFKTLESGRELILNIFGIGESVGEVALIDKDVFPASASAQQESICLEFSRDSYFEMGRKFPEALYSTIRDLSHRVRSMTQRIQELGGRNVEEKLAKVFLGLASSGEPRRGGIFVPIPIGRQELADMVGARIETVIRTLGQWQKKEFLLTETGGFFIPSKRQLQNFIQRDL